MTRIVFKRECKRCGKEFKPFGKGNRYCKKYLRESGVRFKNLK